MREAVARLWPEIQWIGDTKLREQVTATWIRALERSPLKPDDLNHHLRRRFSICVHLGVGGAIKWLALLL